MLSTIEKILALSSGSCLVFSSDQFKAHGLSSLLKFKPYIKRCIFVKMHFVNVNAQAQLLLLLGVG